MKKLRFLLIGIVLIGGCATANQLNTPDGEKGYSINCSGSALNWGMCYEIAGELCGTRGYDVIDRSGDQGGSIVANQFGLYGGSTMYRSMIIKCKGEMPSLYVASKKPMASLPIDKKMIPLSLMVAQENIHENNNKLSERWEKAGTTLNGLQLFIDNNTKSKPSEDIVRVWVKTIANTDNYTDLLEIDCVQVKIKKIDNQKESIAFPEQTNEWKFIVPETASELIFKSVCLKK